MANPKLYPEGEHVAADLDLRRDAALLFPDRPSRGLGDATKLVELVKLLILCHTSTERRAVALRYFHGLSFDQVGRRMGLAAKRAEEIAAGVAARLRIAETFNSGRWPGQR